MWKSQQNRTRQVLKVLFRIYFVIDTSLKYLSSSWVNTWSRCSPKQAKNLNTKQRFGKKKKMNGNIFVKLFLSDLDKKINKNKAAPCGADNLFKLLTS